MSQYFVAVDGDDDNSGLAPSAPFRTVQRGVDALEAGDSLLLRDGVYVEHVSIQDKVRITVQSYPGEHAVLDGARADFRHVPNNLWRPGNFAGEYVTRHRFPPGTDRGAFLGPAPYTRLITYSNLNDFRAVNQKFGPLVADDDLPGPLISNPPDGRFPKRPWVYMGPGLYQDDRGFVHVRLSRTRLGVPGISDYSGAGDPRLLPLAIWTVPEATLRIRGCTTVRIENLTVRFGGGRTIHVDSSSDVLFDHLRVLAGPYALEVGDNCNGTVVTNCSFDGGMPPWYFRSDRKDGYLIADTLEPNGLGEQTLKVLIACSASSSSTSFESCEFINAHDLQLNGDGIQFRRNWIRNINDDGIYIGGAGGDLRVSGNVFERCLMAISVAKDSPVGTVYVYRNLIDLRKPTAGRRPVPHPENVPDDEDTSVWRYGNMFKSNGNDPELNVFHNTVVIVQHPRTVYNLFRSYDGISVRRAFNNIFVGIDRSDVPDLPLAFLPRLTDNAETDGNCYFVINGDSPTLLRVRPPNGGTGEPFGDIGELHQSTFFDQSVTAHPPGFEASGTSENPRLRQYWLPWPFSLIDDLRPVDSSPVCQGGATLPDVLDELDGNPSLPVGIGCYPCGAPPMAVGVDGLRLFPPGT